MTLCPHCKQGIPSFNVEPLNAYAQGNVWKAISFNCPSCHVSLSVQIDPIAIRTDLINEIRRTK